MSERIRNATIIRADLDTEVFGTLSMIIGVQYGDNSYQTMTLRNMERDAGIHVGTLLQVLRIHSFNRLAFQPVRVRVMPDRMIEAIGHIVDESWYAPGEMSEAGDQPHAARG